MSDNDKIGPIKRSQLALLFQPQVSADGKAIVCVEALIRQDHPTRGRLSAGEVLRHFDTIALREELDWWVLGEACRQSLRWPQLSVSVNITATQFRNIDFSRRVFSMIEAAGIPPGRVELEILESAFIKDFDAATANINALREGGVRIALDDFGTGYSSLTYLQRIPIDKLKIDKSFVDKSEFIQSAAIIQALVAMARALGMKVTAEGVETMTQHQFLRTIGCHYLQGYLFSPPTSADAITRMLEDQARVQQFATPLAERSKQSA